MILRPVVLKKRISYLTISDIHTLNKLTSTEFIADSLFHYFDGFKSTSPFAKLDIIFLAGDIFDYYEDSKSPNIALVMNFMKLLMGFCVKHKIKLRSVYGTPSHDWKQARLFAPIAAAFGDALDYKYTEELEIEIMEDLGISVLYVPDEWKNSAAKAKEDVQKALDDAGLEKVTLAIMHGMFDFQIPDLPIDHPLKHDSKWYLEKVETYINIGHDHVFKTLDRILVQGSFDRIAHGEEGKKGGIVCTLDPVLGNSFEFVENKRAKIFKTITVKTRDIDQAAEQIKNVLKDIPNHSHIRISSTPDNPIFTVFNELKRSHPTLTFKKHKDKKQVREQEKNNKLQETIDLKSSYTSVTIVPDNIVGLIKDSMDLVDVSEEDLELLSYELERLV